MPIFTPDSDEIIPRACPGAAVSAETTLPCRKTQQSRQAKPARLSAPATSKPTTPGLRSYDTGSQRTVIFNQHNQHAAGRSYQRGGRFHIRAPGKVAPSPSTT